MEKKNVKKTEVGWGGKIKNTLGRMGLKAHTKVTWRAQNKSGKGEDEVERKSKINCTAETGSKINQKQILFPSKCFLRCCCCFSGSLEKKTPLGYG